MNYAGPGIRAEAGYSLRAVAYGQGRFVAVGNGGMILQSAPLQLRQEQPVRLSSGTLHGRVSNLETTNCVIETSADLTNGQVLTKLTTMNAWAPFTDAEATHY